MILVGPQTFNISAKTNVDQPRPTVVNIVQAQVIPALEDFGRRLIKNAKT
jgi:hypothetical protein